MDTKLKHRIVGFAVLIVLAIILIPFMLKRSDSIDGTKLSSQIPNPPAPQAVDDNQSQTVPLAIKPLQVSNANNQAPANNVLANPDNSANTNMIATAVEAAPATAAVQQAPSAQQQFFAPAPSANYKTTEQPIAPTAPTEAQSVSSPTNDAGNADAPSAPRTKTGKVKTKFATNTATNTTHVKQHVTVATAGAAWTIQLGSFSNKSNADKLVKQLRAKGFAAYVTEANNNTGTSTNRVFVGPETERTKADQLLKKLEAEFKLSGVVVKYRV